MTDKIDGFEVVDKRKISPDETEDDQPEQEVTTDEQGQQEESSAGSDTEQADDVTSLLFYVLSLLAAAAWQWMGLVKDPSSGVLKIDLKQARLAIDTFEAVADKLKPMIDAKPAREIQNALADLRMNFVERATPTGSATEQN